MHTLILTLIGLGVFLMVLGTIKTTITKTVTFLKHESTYLYNDAVGDVKHGLTWLKGYTAQHPELVKIYDDFISVIKSIENKE